MGHAGAAPTLHTCTHHTQVAAWRCRGKVPLAVDVTAALVEVQLQDAEVGLQHGPAEDAPSNTMRLMYALPIIRWAAMAVFSPYNTYMHTHTHS